MNTLQRSMKEWWPPDEGSGGEPGAGAPRDNIFEFRARGGGSPEAGDARHGPLRFLVLLLLALLVLCALPPTVHSL